MESRFVFCIKFNISPCNIIRRFKSLIRSILISHLIKPYCIVNSRTLLYTLTLIATCLITQTSFAQTLRISGRIIEDHSQESIPFVNIFLQGTTIGTTSDMDGSFVLEADQWADSIGVSAIGYKTEYKALSKSPEQNVSFRLIRDDILMDEIVVIAGENPADIILRKIIENKHKNDIDQSDY